MIAPGWISSSFFSLGQHLINNFHVKHLSLVQITVNVFKRVWNLENFLLVSVNFIWYLILIHLLIPPLHGYGKN